MSPQQLEDLKARAKAGLLAATKAAESIQNVAKVLSTIDIDKTGLSAAEVERLEKRAKEELPAKAKEVTDLMDKIYEKRDNTI